MHTWDCACNVLEEEKEAGIYLLISDNIPVEKRAGREEKASSVQ